MVAAGNDVVQRMEFMTERTMKVRTLNLWNCCLHKPFVIAGTMQYEAIIASCCAAGAVWGLAGPACRRLPLDSGHRVEAQQGKGAAESEFTQPHLM